VHRRKEESGFAFDLISVMVMSAFSVEAYLNHLGAKKFRTGFLQKRASLFGLNTGYCVKS